MGEKQVQMNFKKIGKEASTTRGKGETVIISQAVEDETKKSKLQNRKENSIVRAHEKMKKEGQHRMRRRREKENCSYALEGS